MKPYLDSASAAEPAWVKSSFSGTNNNCVEVAVTMDGSRAIRDSKNQTGLSLVFTSEEFTAFIRAVQNGEFTQP